VVSWSQAFGLSPISEYMLNSNQERKYYGPLLPEMRVLFLTGSCGTTHERPTAYDQLTRDFALLKDLLFKKQKYTLLIRSATFSETFRNVYNLLIRPKALQP
jgi:hypothetical protein